MAALAQMLKTSMESCIEYWKLLGLESGFSSSWETWSMEHPKLMESCLNRVSLLSDGLEGWKSLFDIWFVFLGVDGTFSSTFVAIGQVSALQASMKWTNKFVVDSSSSGSWKASFFDGVRLRVDFLDGTKFSSSLSSQWTEETIRITWIGLLKFFASFSFLLEELWMDFRYFELVSLENYHLDLELEV